MDFPADEDSVPLDADPHPEHGPIALGHHPVQPRWQQEVQGAANNLGFIGANPHPNPANPIPLDQNHNGNQNVNQGANNMEVNGMEARADGLDAGAWGN